MSKEEIGTKIKSIVCDYVDANPEDIDTKQAVSSEMGIDSFALISMVGNIESEFGISIPDTAFANFETLDDIISFVAESI